MKADLIRSIRKLITSQPYEIGITIKIDYQQELAINADRQFRSASLIKLAVINYVLASHQDLSREIQLNPDKMVGGAGVLQLLSIPRLRLRDLLALMISVSDNAATNFVIDGVGKPKINQYLQQQGFTKTRLNRNLMDTSALRNGLDNFTSASESQRLLEMVLAKYPIAKPWFLNQQFRYKLAGAFDESGNGIQVFNKTGEGYQIDHDVAEFVYGNHTVSVALLTFGSRDRSKTIQLFNQIGEKCADYLLNR